MLIVAANILHSKLHGHGGRRRYQRRQLLQLVHTPHKGCIYVLAVLKLGPVHEHAALKGTACDILLTFSTALGATSGKSM